VYSGSKGKEKLQKTSIDDPNDPDSLKGMRLLETISDDIYANIEERATGKSRSDIFVAEWSHKQDGILDSSRDNAPVSPRVARSLKLGQPGGLLFSLNPKDVSELTRLLV
jgi:hypothetical protein